jgi:lipopolysaccharide/colanic/teichoic acid biosynthesis glycosyltransferase
VAAGEGFESVQTQLPIRGDTVLRRTVDLAVGLPALLLFSPFLLLIAVLVKLDSPGSVLYAQRRVGRGEKPFRILKFRSMVADAEKIGPAVSGHQDARITRAGRVLRATKLDELPQILNVIRGEMTLIGPRAEVERYIEHYTPDERLLLQVRPGLTGPGQVYFTTDQAGELDAATDPETLYVTRQIHAKLALDLNYLRHRSFPTDLSILRRTLALLGRWK